MFLSLGHNCIVVLHGHGRNHRNRGGAYSGGGQVADQP